MARQAFKRCLGVDIGATSVKIAEVVADKGGAKVINLVRAAIPAFPDPEAAELGTAKIIRDLLKERNIRTRDAVFCLPGQQIFTRRVRLPDASEDRLMRIINYEARQQIPFPEDKTRIEYQIFRLPDQDDVEVLLVAARKDQVASYMKLVGRTGLRPICLSVSSLALFNFHAFELTPFVKESKKSKKKSQKLFKKEGESEEAGGGEEREFLDDEATQIDEVRGFINVGESYTDLVIGRKGKIVTPAFVRSIPIAGRDLTRVIQNAAGLNDPAEAVRLKHEQVRIFSSMYPPDGDPAINEEVSQAASEIIENRLAKQIQLSLDFFTAQPDGMMIDSLSVSGGSSGMPGIAELLEDRLGVPVQVYSEQQNPAMLVNVQPERAFADYLIAIGAALGGIEFAPIALNFLPESAKTRLVFPRIEVAIMAILIAVMVYASTMIGTSYIAEYTQETQKLQGIYTQFQPRQQEIMAAEQARTEIKTSIEGLLDTIDFRQRTYFLEFYSELVKTLKESAPLALLIELEVEAHGKFTLEGASTNAQDGANVRRALLEMTRFVEQARLVGTGRPGATFRIMGELKGKRSRINTPRPTPPPAGQAGGGFGGGGFGAGGVF